MQNLQQMSRFQFISILLWSVMGTGVLTLPWSIGQFVSRDAWMSALLLFVVPVLAGVVSTLFVRMFPGQSLVEGLIEALGPWVGRALSLWFLVWLLLLSAMILRELTLFLETTVLPKTPLYVLSAMATLPLTYLVLNRIEAIGRMAAFFTPLALLVTGGLLSLAIPHMDFRHLLPVLADGWRPVLRGGVVPWAWASETLTALQFVNALGGKERLVWRDFLIVGALMALLGGLAEVVITSVIGEQRVYSMFPILEVVRTIQLSEFLERLDPFYVMGVTSLIVIKTASFQYSFCTGLEQVFGLKSYASVVWVSGFLIWSGSIFFWKDSATLAEYMLFTVPVYYIGTMFGLPILAVLAKWMRQYLFRSIGSLTPGS